jgi:putative holliday junction resolvase
VAHPRTLALDVGDKRIGLAITDELGLTAQPLFTLHRTSPRADIKAVSRFIRQHNVAVILVGNPLNVDGSAGTQSVKALAFATELREAHPTLEHHLLDERLTTREAHTLLDEAGHLRRSVGHAARIERQHLIDQVAAVLILKSYLSKDGPALLPDPDLQEPVN